MDAVITFPTYVDFASFHEFAIGFWNCSDNVVLFSCHFLLLYDSVSRPLAGNKIIFSGRCL